MRAAGPVAIDSNRSPDVRSRWLSASDNRAGAAPVPRTSSSTAPGVASTSAISGAKASSPTSAIETASRPEIPRGVARIEPTWLMPAKRKPPPP